MYDSNLYNRLRASDPEYFDLLVRELKVTPEMINSNMSIEDYKHVVEKGVPVGAISPRWQSMFNHEEKFEIPVFAQEREKDWTDVYRTVRNAFSTYKTLKKLPKTIKNLKSIVNDGITESASDASTPAASDSVHIADAAANYSDTASEHVQYASATLKTTGDVIGSSDDITHTLNEAFSNVGDIADSANHLSDAAGHVATAGENIGQIGTSFFGPVGGALLGMGIDHAFVKYYEKRIRTKMEALSPIDFKIAAEYYEHNKDRSGDLPPLNLLESQAFENLYDIMARHGGGKLLSQKILRGTGTAAGFLGGPGGGLAVWGIVRAMEANHGIPTVMEVSEKWASANLIGAAGTIGGVIVYPPSLFFTVPAMISGNMAAKRIKTEVQKWHDTLTSDDGKKLFLKEIGEQASSIIKEKPEEFVEEKLRKKMLTLAEVSAEAIANGMGKYNEEHVKSLMRYGKSALKWFNITAATVGGVLGGGEDYYIGEHGMLNFIKEAKIIEHSDSLIESARQNNPAKSK